jgi:RNA polymerase sigma-70 factor (ECF subfamily)
VPIWLHQVREEFTSHAICSPRCANGHAVDRDSVQRSSTDTCLSGVTFRTEVGVSEPRARPAAADSTKAYDADFARIRDRLRRIAAGLVGDDADDVVQDTYVRGLARRHQLRDPDLFDAWITRIAIRLCLDRRSAGRRLADAVHRLAAPHERPQVRDLSLHDLIEQLPLRERTLVVLHYGHGYSMEDIARLTGLTAVNVRTIVFRARRRLRDWLEAEDE